MKTDGSGVLVRIGNKAELIKAISNADEVMAGRDKSDYTGDYASAWTALETEIAAANIVKDSDDVNQSQVDAARDKLIQAVAVFVNTTLEMKISAAKAAKQGKNESDYSSYVWKELTDAITEAEGLKENEEASQQEKLAACDRLDAALAEFKPIDKEAAEALKEMAEAALEGKNKEHYDAAVWEELEAAIEAYRDLPENADRSAIIEAYNRMYAALENFKPIDREAAEILKEKAEAALEGKNKDDYEEAVWTELLNAIEAYKNLPEDADRSAIIEAYNRLNEALKNFVPKTFTPVSGVTLNKNELTLMVGGSEILTATVQPEHASNKDVIWQSSNAAIAGVENGKVTAVTAGTAMITAVSAEDSSKYASCTVTVTAQGNQGGQENVNPAVKVKSVKLRTEK